jgi:hypothetical protein
MPPADMFWGDFCGDRPGLSHILSTLPGLHGGEPTSGGPSMPRWTKCCCAIAGLVCLTLGPVRAQTVADDGVTVRIAGRTFSCGQTPVVIDPDIPAEGMSVPGDALYLNPFLLRQHPAGVRMFVFEHECAHEIVGPDELAADCLAAQAGIRAGWLRGSDVAAICKSLEGPATSTHPSGDARCANIKRCMGSVHIAAGGTAKTSSWSSATAADRAPAASGARQARGGSISGTTRPAAP